jgi:archaeal flagellar protein FlaI
MTDKKNKKQGFGSIFKKNKSSGDIESQNSTEHGFFEPVYPDNNSKSRNKYSYDDIDQNEDDLSALLLKFRPQIKEKEEPEKNYGDFQFSVLKEAVQNGSPGKESPVEEKNEDFSEIFRLKEQKEADQIDPLDILNNHGSAELENIFKQMKNSEEQKKFAETERYDFPDIFDEENTGCNDGTEIIKEENHAIIEEQTKEAEDITDSPGFPGINSQKPKTLQEIIDSVTKKPENTPAPEKREQLPQIKEEIPAEIIAEKDTPARLPAQKPPQAKKTQWSENSDEKEDSGIILINQNSVDFSGLILPEGATFEIEEFKIETRKGIPKAEDRETVLSRIDQIAEKSPIAAEIREIVVQEPEAEQEQKHKKEKKGLFSKFKTEITKIEGYDPETHGALVNLDFRAEEGIEEVELYPVNEPYAYVRITYDKGSNEYIYNILEPELNDAEKELFSEIEQRLFETLDVNTKSISTDEAKQTLKTAVLEILHDYGIKLTPNKREKIIYIINKNFIGDGLIDPLMHDKYIEDISCDGLNTPIFVFHSNYESLQTNLMYYNSSNLDSFVTKLAQRAGKYISIAEPMLDATMADGSRIQMTLGTEVTAHGSTFTIRKFKEEPITPTDLTEWGTFSPLSIAYIWIAVEAGKSCIFAGGTASGKTTSLNAISLFIPPLAKIVTLEDTRELKLPHKNWIPSITRESFDADGKGTIDMYELLRAALRQRPEYILVGEVRGQEALTLFQAMSTGHVTYATMHADSVSSVVHRLENPPLNVPRNMLNALDLVSVQVQARIGGKRIRRNKQLIEVLDIDPRTRELITNEVFKWHPSTDEIRYSGKSYILEEIMEERGWNDDRMKEELKRRQEILEWMRIKNLRNYKDVGRVLMSYFRDPDAVIKIVRAELYEQL